MRFEFKLAWKYFRARRKSLARFTSVVAVVGIAAGVASLIIAQALTSGFGDEMRDKILANTAHITIFSANSSAGISNWRAAKAEIEKLEKVRQVLPSTFQNALVTGKDATSYAVLRVIENSDKQNSNEIEISLGAQLAEKMNLKTGDEAEIITLENQSLPERSVVRVSGTFQTGLYEYDASWIYISPENFARLVGKRAFTPTNLNVLVRDIYKADLTANEIRARLGNDFKVVDWQQANQPLFAALSLERKVALAIISLIIFIAVLNITTTLALLVGERRFDIAILRTCGAQARSLILVFFLEGLFLGFSGIFAGVVIGLLGCFLGNYFRLVSLSAEVYSLNYIPFHINLTTIIMIVLIAFALCLAATVYPALKASRIKPLENLRTQ
jgi:lipoprotein-releasing system permease protein